MSDATLVWGGDLTISPTGDLGMSNGGDLGQQRVLRRLLTNPNDDVWHADYGGGLGQFIGNTPNARTIEGTIRGQLYAEAAVAHQPEPSVTTSALTDGSIYVSIVYADAPTKAAQTLTFSLGY